jgi:hypothetical protein
MSGAGLNLSLLQQPPVSHPAVFPDRKPFFPSAATVASAARRDNGGDTATDSNAPPRKKLRFGPGVVSPMPSVKVESERKFSFR